MKQSEHTITCADGFELATSHFEPDRFSRATVVVASAMGVPRSYYRYFAAWLAENGYTAITFDYRGINDSRSAGVRGSHIRMQDWGELDIDAVLAGALNDGAGTPVFLLGHSCGGQLPGLAENSKHISGLVLVGAQQGNWRLWPFPDNLAIILALSVLLPLFSLGREYFPARRLRLSGVDVPAGVIRQWSSFGRQREYLFSTKFRLDLSRYAAFTFPVLACGVSDDRFAPKKATEGLLAKFPGTRIQRMYIDTREIGKVGHFGYFRSGMEDVLWEGIRAWLDERTSY